MPDPCKDENNNIPFTITIDYQYLLLILLNFHQTKTSSSLMGCFLPIQILTIRVSSSIIPHRHINTPIKNRQSSIINHQSPHHSITPSLHHSTTPSLHHSITPPLHHSIPPPPVVSLQAFCAIFHVNKIPLPLILSPCKTSLQIFLASPV